jgi:hypothetical protein
MKTLPHSPNSPIKWMMKYVMKLNNTSGIYIFNMSVFLQQMCTRVQFHMGFTLINAQMLKNLGETNESSLKLDCN